MDVTGDSEESRSRSLGDKPFKPPGEETMKIRLLLALAGLAINFALPAFAQQKEPTPNEQDRQWLDTLVKKFDEVWNNNDAVALAALYAEDAVIVTDTGPIYGRNAIAKHFADLFKQVHFSNHIAKADQYSPHMIGTDKAWSNGQWSTTIQVQNGSPIQLKGYWSDVNVREGNTWKDQLETFNISPAPAATGSQQTNKPDPQLRERLVARIKAHTDALDKNDAAAVAANFTEDGVNVEQDGTTFGREAIQKLWADRFQNVHFSNNLVTVDEDSPHFIGTDGKQMWATGAWSATIKGEKFGPTQIKGYWSVIREGDDWKIRMLTSNVTPAPAATPSPTASSSNQ